jgi:hypothetical protein
MRITTKGQVTIPQVVGEGRLRKARRGRGKLSRRDGVIGRIRSVRPSNKLMTDATMALMRGKS